MIRWFRRKRKRRTLEQVHLEHLIMMFEPLPKPKVQIPTPPRQLNPKYSKIQHKYF